MQLKLKKYQFHISEKYFEIKTYDTVDKFACNIFGIFGFHRIFDIQ